MKESEKRAWEVAVYLAERKQTLLGDIDTVKAILAANDELKRLRESVEWACSDEAWDDHSRDNFTMEMDKESFVAELRRRAGMPTS